MICIRRITSLLFLNAVKDGKNRSERTFPGISRRMK